MKSNFFFHFFLVLFGFFIGNLFPTFFGQLLGSATSFFLLVIFEFLHFITAKQVSGMNSAKTAIIRQDPFNKELEMAGLGSGEVFRSAESTLLDNEAKRVKRMSATDRKMRQRQNRFTFSHTRQSLDSIKIGILFGLFVDAFKVGS